MLEKILNRISEKYKIKKLMYRVANEFSGPSDYNFWQAYRKIHDYLENSFFYAEMAYNIRQSFFNSDHSIITQNTSTLEFLNTNKINTFRLTSLLERDSFAIYSFESQNFIEISPSQKISNIDPENFSVTLNNNAKINNVFVFHYGTIQDTSLSEKNKIMKAIQLFDHLKNIENIINIIQTIFGNVTLVFKSDVSTLKNLAEQLSDWSLGQALFLSNNSDVQFLSLEYKNLELLFEQRMYYLKLLSNFIGIPIFLLGFPELMSNRATASEYLELVNITTQAEVNKIKSMLQHFYKVLLKRNNALIPEDLTIEYRIQNRIVEDYLFDKLYKMKTENLISTSTFLNKVGFIENPQEEIAKINNEIRGIGESL